MEDVVVESEEAFTCTFGFRGENHVGNQIIGEAEPRDLSAAAVEALHETFEKKGVESTLIKLEEELLPPPAAGKPWPKARVLAVTQKGVKKLLKFGEAELYAEAKRLKFDRKVLARGKVVNKHARFCTTMADFGQEPCYEEGKGTVNNFKDFPAFDALRGVVAECVGEKPEEKTLIGEVNHYYDKWRGIGFHGDAERAISKDPKRGKEYGGGMTVGMRIGPGAKGMPLRFLGYLKKRAIGKMGVLALGRGALYFMCGKANGGDFKQSNVQTWRHAAGHDAKRWGEPSGVQGKELKKEGKKWPVKAVYPRV
ncbi:MAG: hypothetical protein CMK83_01370 [Pseudomonadales bacterium]|nr:hypothetical protein [Pseudomonadales bacterium]